MKQLDIFSSSANEYLLIVEPAKEIIDRISDFKSGFSPLAQKFYFKKPHLTLGSFVLEDTFEEDLLRRLRELAEKQQFFDFRFASAELLDDHKHLVYKFRSEHYTKQITPELKKVIGKQNVLKIPHITIMSKPSGIERDYTVNLPEIFSFPCTEYILIKWSSKEKDSYRVIRRFLLKK